MMGVLTANRSGHRAHAPTPAANTTASPITRFRIGPPRIGAKIPDPGGIAGVFPHGEG